MKINTTQDNTPAPKKSGKKRLWFWTKIIGTMMIILIALGLIFNKPLMGLWVKSQTSPNNYLKVSKAQMKKNTQKKGNFDTNSVAEVSPENLAKAAMSNETSPVTGGISIPQLGINLPIMLDDGDFTMLKGAGPIQEGEVMGEGNYVLASHDMWTNMDYYSKTLLFSPLKQAQKGQDIYVTNKDKVYHYVSYDIRKILPTDWNDATDEIPGKKVITLLTCDTDDKYRILVRGELKDVKPFNDTTAAPFTGEYNAYQK